MGILRYIFIVFVFLATPAFATTYYVDSTPGTDCAGGAGTSYRVAERDCGGSDGTKSYAHPASTNSVAQAGDIVYLRGNTEDYLVYNIGAMDSSTEGIHPDNSGTDADHRITFATYQNEKVHFVGNHAYSRAVLIIDKDWIKITGYDGSTSACNLKISNMYWFLYIRSNSSTGGAGSNYNEVSYVEFTQNNSTAVDSRGSTIYRNSTYNWIHHCIFSKFGSYTTTSSDGFLFEIGNETVGSTDSTSNNVIENNHFFHAGHHTLGIHQKNNVIRNNHFHNEQWWLYATNSQYYGYRCLYMAGEVGGEDVHGYNLLEGNIISHGSGNLNNNNYGGGGLSLNQSNDIIRYNDFYANGLGGIYIQCATGEKCNSNHIYNNTWLSNGYLSRSYDTLGGSYLNTNDTLRRPVRLHGYISGQTVAYAFSDAADLIVNNVVKNNLFWKNSYYETSEQVAANIDWTDTDCTDQANCGNTIIENNWEYSSGDPLFTNEGSYGSPSIITASPKEWYWGANDPDGSDITATNTEPTLTLQSSSPAINAGTYLTQANGSGSSSTTLIVDDAKYFQAGWGNGAGGGAVVAADQISIGTVGNTVAISSIDYATNTITLAEAKTWSDNANIWLYKKSDSVVILSQTAPDMGAHEYTPTGDTYTVTISASGTGCAAPSSRDITSGQTVELTPTMTHGGYKVLSAGGTCGGALSGNTYTTSAITGACTVTFNCGVRYLFR